MRINLFPKLLLFSALLATLPIAMVGGISLRATEAELKSAVNDELLVTAEQIAERIDSLFQDQWLAPLDLAARTLASPDLTASAKLALLTRVSALPDLVALQISSDNLADPVLIVQDQIAERIAQQGASARHLLHVPHAQLHSSAQHGKVTHIPTPALDLLHLMLPVDLPGSSEPTLLSARIDLRRLHTWLAQHPFNHHGKILLLNAEGEPLLGGNSEILETNDFIHHLREIRHGSSARIGVMPFTTTAGHSLLGGYALPHQLPWTVVVERDGYAAYLPVRQMRDRLLTWIAFALLLAAVGAWLLARRISTPVVLIERAAMAVGEGRLDSSVPDLRRGDEIGRLGKRINEMIQGLRDRERIKDIFGRYQNEEVMRTLLESPGGLELGGERRTITIMMSDLRGFTALSEAHPPEQVVQMLNHYFEPMFTICQRHGGTINEIIGDGLFVMFGAPLRMEDHAHRALRCALEMQLAMEPLNHELRELGLPSLQMGIGLNSGEVIIGNLGSTRRAKFGAVGSDVNLTARIESFTVGGQILVSEKVAAAVGEDLLCGEISQVEAKGVKGHLTLIEALGIAGEPPLHLPHTQHPLTPLTPPLSLHCTALSGSDASAPSQPGELLALGEVEAEIALTPALPPLTNIKLQLDHPQAVGLELYAKTRAITPQGNRIRFTRIPEAAQPLLTTLRSAP